MYSLIIIAKLNNTDPRAWLADVLRRINDHPASHLHELLPWSRNKPPPGHRPSRLTHYHHGPDRMDTGS